MIDTNSMNNMKQQSNRGIALLVTLLLTSVLLSVSASMLNISVNQFQLSNISRDSEMAFQAASTGIECIAYHDKNTSGGSPFAVNGNGSGTTSETGIECMDDSSNDLVGGDDSCTTCDEAGLVESGEEQKFRFDWGSPNLCTEVSIYKFFSETANQEMKEVMRRTDSVMCPSGSVCTIIRSRGYAVPCDNIDQPRTLERELVERY